jgi:anti-sigma B factor antagonist
VKTEFEFQNGAMIVQLNGRFDAFETAPIIEWFEHNVKTSQANVVVDLSGVNFLDSAALAALVKGMKRCREWGGDLYLSGLQQSVQIIFELTRLDKAFKIFPDSAAASSAF